MHGLWLPVYGSGVAMIIVALARWRRSPMAAVYLLVPLLDSMLSHLRPGALATLSIVLVVIFTADMIYSHSNPNIGEGITDYDAYKENVSCLELQADERDFCKVVPLQ